MIRNPIFKIGCIYEVRIHKTAHGTVSGYFDNEQDLNTAVLNWDGKAKSLLEDRSSVPFVDQRRKGYEVQAWGVLGGVIQDVSGVNNDGGEGGI